MDDSSKFRFTGTLRRLIRVSKPEVEKQERKEQAAKRRSEANKSA